MRMYRVRDLNGVSIDILDKYFDKVEIENDTIYRTCVALRTMIRFNHLNLLSPWPMKGLFDVIFCRNVVIYFDPTTQERLWLRFRKQLYDDAHLFLGHSERITSPETSGFRVAGPTSYVAV